jgi:hypothetical protein
VRFVFEVTLIDNVSILFCFVRCREYRTVTNRQIVYSSQKVLHTNVNTALKNEPLLRRRHKGCYLGGDMSLSFSEAGSPPMPQCVLGIS